MTDEELEQQLQALLDDAHLIRDSGSTALDQISAARDAARGDRDHRRAGDELLAALHTVRFASETAYEIDLRMQRLVAELLGYQELRRLLFSISDEPSDD